MEEKMKRILTAIDFLDFSVCSDQHELGAFRKEKQATLGYTGKTMKTRLHIKHLQKYEKSM